MNAVRLQSLGDLFTLRGAASALGVSYKHLWRYVHSHPVRVYKLGKNTLVRLDDLRDMPR